MGGDDMTIDKEGRLHLATRKCGNFTKDECQTIAILAEGGIYQWTYGDMKNDPFAKKMIEKYTELRVKAACKMFENMKVMK